ncbi:MAG: cyclophilin-like fold protein [Thermodesulfobacteriota bacterium]
MKRSFSRTRECMFLVLAAVMMFSHSTCGADGGSAVTAPSVKPAEVTNESGKGMKIRIKVGDKEAIGTLNDSPAARDFASLLPLTLDLEDYVKTEKIGYLPRKLTIEGSANNPDSDIAYYAPWGNLAIFYKVVPSSGNGLIILGKIDSNKEIFNVPGSLKATIELDKEQEVK